MPAAPLLAIEDLSIGFRGEHGIAPVIDHLSLTIEAGRIVGLVGESGCGKSVTARAIMRLLPMPPAQIDEGRILLDDDNLLSLDDAGMRDVRGNQIGMVFQEPMTSLNPTLPIGFQVGEALRLHQKLDRATVRRRVLETLDLVGIGAAERRFEQYPHELSGGLRQRVMIAISLICRPRLLIADEPTTALDVTIQAQILELLVSLRDELGMAILLITHDLGVVANYADEVMVMYAGKLVETGPVGPLFDHPRHPYTDGLLGAIPRLSQSRATLSTIPGTVPDPASMPKGCRFAARCDRAIDRCISDQPLLEVVDDPLHAVACWNPV
ncbi:MAG: ABC transporter ATP-binding protein [Alphaproteobacteria bacterium]|nr:ABC transporter ATP-binding protein [Alphaproteobacteria bacterium]